MNSAKGEQWEIKDVIDGILYRLGPRPQFNVKDQIPSGSNLIFLMSGLMIEGAESESDAGSRP